MSEFASGTDVTLIFLHEYKGVGLTLTGFEYEVLDASGTVLVARTALAGFDQALTQSEVTITAANNTTTKKRDARQVNAYMITASGTYELTEIYMLANNPLQLTVMQDSFVTFAESKLVRFSIPEALEAFDMLPDELKVVALEAAYERMIALQYHIGATIYTDLSTMTSGAFNALDNKFVTAMKKAQLVEANEIVEQSPVADKIKAGIISETIGESSMFFKQGGSPKGKFNGLSDEAYVYLKKYLYRKPSNSQIWRIGRA